MEDYIMANFIEELYYGNIESQIEWVKRMNSIRNGVKEIIWNEIVEQQKSIGKFFADAFYHLSLCILFTNAASSNLL